jgi:hypothetical protein
MLTIGLEPITHAHALLFDVAYRVQYGHEQEDLKKNELE